VQFRTITTRPAKLDIDANALGFISRIGEVGSFRWNTKTPNVTFPRTIRFGIVDLINTPVVRSSRYKTIRKSKAGKTNDDKRIGLVAYKFFYITFVTGFKIIADLDIV